MQLTMIMRGAFLSAALLVSPAVAQKVDFNRDVRPILSDKCFTCHGPDSANRTTKLRFDTEQGAKQDLGKGRLAIVPGNPARSLLIERVTSENKVLRMPPAYTGAARLSDAEIDTLKRWIAQGAPWKTHWALEVPRRPDVPSSTNAIDYFVRQRLRREGLQPSPEAPRHTLLRRLSFDLTGLPPSPEELDAFLKDSSPNAYEKAVDRLLASPRYGERMAIRWLDAARYADTNGYQTDAERSMWRWRDWVIQAFNANMPFDRFTIEQLAGDLLPDPKLDQLIATGFNRNHRGNGEGGIIPEEYAVEYVVDRIETTSTIWLGLTMGCARCHDHKYDPITQKDFYRFYAYFNNIPERGKYFKYGNTPPLIPAPTESQQKTLEELRRNVEQAEAKFAAPDAARQAWEQSIAAGPDLQWSSKRDLHFEHAATETFDGKRLIDAGQFGRFGFYDKFTLAAWINPSAPDGAILTRAEDEKEGQGYGLYLKDGKLQLNMVTRWLDDCARVESAEPIPLNRWQHVLAVYDGTREAENIKVYLNGEPVKLNVLVDELNQGFTSGEPLRIGGGGGWRFEGSIRDVRIYRAAFTPAQVRMLAEPASLNQIASIAPGSRSQAQKDKLHYAFLDQFAPEAIRASWQKVMEARNQYATFRDSLPTVMVMQENPRPSDAFMLIRGAYDRPGEKVARGLPAVLPPMPAGAPNNRLGLARWLVDPANPLTARVTVNRFWQMLFGTGLVKTTEDFGSQGEPPTHPELLDWLATEFVRTGWDVKALMKTMVMSETYRQSSRVSPALLARDPDNLLLARGARFRLAPEMVRDQALAISGLLVEKLGGRSVKPYQPAGLWKELSGGDDYQRGKGEELYRRSLYTFWKRAVPPPGMMTFDSAGRETCVVRQTRTNTPLQALTLMNDVTYIEAARKMAERMMRNGGIPYGFLLATSRKPTSDELALLQQSLARFRDKFLTDPAAAEKLLAEGDSPRDPLLDVSELAAYTSLASLILNLDETVSKE
jgi:hypothetical protein